MSIQLVWRVSFCPALNRFKLDTVAKAVGVSLDHHHRAVDDAACTAEIFVRFVEMLKERDIYDVDALNQQGKRISQHDQETADLSCNHSGKK